MHDVILALCNQLLPSPETSLPWAVGSVAFFYGSPVVFVVFLALIFGVSPTRVWLRARLSLERRRNAFQHRRAVERARMELTAQLNERRSL